ncbi:DNA-binding MarR family transcriptional regulator [Beijerinckia sp. GAS462]|nr:DNA-binding MarR family transcriptional regulator [Beijerinckia sp. GAS462]SEC71414.1 DNA-binding transcriptional regulator, MarR family [Beijerinckia sp. 28-YEA-48]
MTITMQRPDAEQQDQEITIRDLISYRLSKTANLMSRGAALRYRREVDVNLGEWRTLALLAQDSPLSLIRLASHAGLDKAQMSRVVTALVARGLILRRISPDNARATKLSLTRNGRATYRRLIAAAAERDRAFRGCLEPDELKVLERALEKLADQAQVLIKAEAVVSDGSGAKKSK